MLVELYMHATKDSIAITSGMKKHAMSQWHSCDRVVVTVSMVMQELINEQWINFNQNEIKSLV